MIRHLLAAAAALSLCPAPALAQTKAEKDQTKDQAAEADKKIQEAVQREVAKVKEQLRDEVRAEIQGAQAAAEFMGKPDQKKKLELLELNGYFRTRYDLFVRMSLNQGLDPMGYPLFPRFVTDPDASGTQTSANMRFRLDPTFNVSEEIRIRATLDFLDNVILGSTPAGPPRNDLDSTSGSQLTPMPGINTFANALAVKRVWAEVQTPIGLISFGRMPSQWGLGIYANAGNGLDDDLGDNVDRLQIAIPLPSVLGGLTLIPMYDYASAGLTTDSVNPSQAARNTGQGVDLDPADDVGAIGIKVLRFDSPDEARRKLEKGSLVLNYGAWYSYRTQRYAFPFYKLGDNPYQTSYTYSYDYTSIGGSAGTNTITLPPVKRGATSSTLDVWFKMESRRLKVELELVGIAGSIQDATTNPGFPLGPVNVLQAGGAVRGDYKFGEGRFTLGLEGGMASGDSSPGFGNYPGRTVCAYTAAPPPANPVNNTIVVCSTQEPGIIDGRQYSYADAKKAWNNYRFNPAYRVDLILWRELIGGVTDGWYVKPTFRWELLPGLVGTAQIVYSQALMASSTPSTRHLPLGAELDLGLSYTSDDGFVAWIDYGYLQPLDGLHFFHSDPALNRDLARGQALRGGLAVKF
ncbi:MAG TPA: TIGR04551 family protein [Anaeromyxobacteraceae bacterium]|nr:TIGR04551 family protein [Anaeromyxobacteraceae bacterium]